VFLFYYCYSDHRLPHSSPTRRSSDLQARTRSSSLRAGPSRDAGTGPAPNPVDQPAGPGGGIVVEAVRSSEETVGVEAGTDELVRSEEHTSELQSRENLVCRLLLEKKK